MMKVGVIGCGGIAPVHINAYKALDDVEVVALCDLDIEKAKKMANNFRIQRTYSDYWEMLDSNELDLLDICTPTITHTPIVCDIAKAVPSIFLEKPMALTVSECDKMINALNKYGTKCCIDHLQLYSPKILKIKSLIKNEEFLLLSLKTTKKESFDILHALKFAPPWNVSEKHGGIIAESLTHLGYIQLSFLPDISEIYALGGKAKHEVYDNITVLLKTKDERFGLIEHSWVSNEFEIIYEFTGKNGDRLKLHRDYDYLSKHNNFPPFNVGSVLSNIITDEIRVLKKWMSFGIGYLQRHKMKPMYNLIGEYIKTLKNDEPSPVTAEDGKKTVLLNECVKKSLDHKIPVKFSD